MNTHGDGVNENTVAYEQREKLARELANYLDSPELGLSDTLADMWQEVYAIETPWNKMCGSSYWSGMADVMQMAVRELVKVWDRG